LWLAKRLLASLPLPLRSRHHNDRRHGSANCTDEGWLLSCKLGYGPKKEVQNPVARRSSSATPPDLAKHQYHMLARALGSGIGAQLPCLAVTEESFRFLNKSVSMESRKFLKKRKAPFRNWKMRSMEAPRRRGAKQPPSPARSRKELIRRTVNGARRTVSGILFET